MRKVWKVTCWWWEISVFHWCQLAIHSHDNAHVLDSDRSYTWMIMCWWVCASACHETSMTEWWEWKQAWSRPRSTPTNLSSLDSNENNRAYSEMDAPDVNPVIRKTLSTISPFLTRVPSLLLSLIKHSAFIWLQRKVTEIITALHCGASL